MIKFLTLLILLTLPIIAQSEEGDWGAIAFGKGDIYIAYGASGMHPSERSAVAAALAVCKKQNPTCEVVKTFKNSCIVVYISSNWNIIFSVNDDIKEADEISRNTCEEKGTCIKTLSYCSGNPLADYI